MKFSLWSAFTLEHWNWHTPDITGIGGSESAHIFTAQELAKRGHEVKSYVPFGGGHSVKTEDGVEWFNSEKDNVLPSDNFWLVYRDPSFFDKDLPPGKYAFVAQDTLYNWTPQQLAKVDYYLCLCRKHAAATLSKHPELKGRVIRWSNGIRRDLIEKIEKENIRRNPKKLVFASSPDRGLLLILQDWFRVREQVPDAELHVFYGMNNAEEIIRRGGNHLKPLMGQLKTLLEQPGVIFRGRISQPELIREWFSSGIFWSPSQWPETSMITIMESMACGVVPVVNNWWAKGENCLNGVLIDGNPEEDDFCRFAMLYEVLHLLKNPAEQEKYRDVLKADARDTFCWTKQVKQIEDLANASKN